MTAIQSGSTETGEFLNLNDIEIALHISGITVVSSIAISETVSLSSLQFHLSHNTSVKWTVRLRVSETVLLSIS